MDNHKHLTSKAIAVSLTVAAFAITLLFSGNALGVRRATHRNSKRNSKKTFQRAFPNGCTQAGYSFKYHVLTLHPHKAGGAQSLFFVHNKTHSSIKLYQMRSGTEPYVIHLNNTIRPNQWGVFSADEHRVKFICAVPKKGVKYGTVVDCGKSVNVCEYVNVKFSSNTRGNYWAETSNTQRGAMRTVIRQGILLRW